MRRLGGLLLLVACSRTGLDTGQSLLPEAGGPPLTTSDAGALSIAVTVTPSSIRLTEGGAAAELAVHVVRSDSAIGAITLTTDALPSGVTATSTTLDSTSSDGSMTLSAGLAATQGPATVVVHAVASNAVGAGTTALFVRGCPGCIDTTFGDQGQVVGAGSGRALAVDDAGRTLVVGGTTSSLSFVARFSADGTPDATFGPSGVTTFGSGSASWAIALTTTGEIVAGGGYTTDDVLSARLETTGALDTTFGTNGIAAPGFSFIASSILVSATGQVLLAGENHQTNSPMTVALARVRADGSADPTFGASGLVTTNFGSSLGIVGPAVVRSQSTKIVVGATAYTDMTSANFVLARFDGSGALDSTFGSGGVSIGTFGAAYQHDVLSDLAITADGIVAAGWVDSTASTAIVARFDADGTLDGTFADGGVLVPDIAHDNAFFRGVVTEADGTIVLVGYTLDDPDKQYGFVMRLTSAGNVDSSFQGGFVQMPLVKGIPYAVANYDPERVVTIVWKITHDGYLLYRYWL